MVISNFLYNYRPHSFPHYILITMKSEDVGILEMVFNHITKHTPITYLIYPISFALQCKW